MIYEGFMEWIRRLVSENGSPHKYQSQGYGEMQKCKDLSAADFCLPAGMDYLTYKPLSYNGPVPQLWTNRHKILKTLEIVFVHSVKSAFVLLDHSRC